MLPTRAYYQNQRFVFHQTPLKLCISLQTLLPFMFKAESLVRIWFIAPKSRVATSRDRISFSQAFMIAFFLRPEFSLIMPAYKKKLETTLYLQDLYIYSQKLALISFCSSKSLKRPLAVSCLSLKSSIILTLCASSFCEIFLMQCRIVTLFLWSIGEVFWKFL